jgi:hypothetical protein
MTQNRNRKTTVKTQTSQNIYNMPLDSTAVIHNALTTRNEEMHSPLPHLTNPR